jgi:hypothetical protein
MVCGERECVGRLYLLLLGSPPPHQARYPAGINVASHLVPHRHQRIGRRPGPWPIARQEPASVIPVR